MGGLIHVGAWNGDEFIDDPRDLLLFEPQSRPFKVLYSRLGGRENVRLVHAAAGSPKGAGVAIMHRVDPDHSSSLLPVGPLRPGFQRDGDELVAVVTVDATIDRYALQGRFDEMRIDTQGYELEVLKGAARTLRDIRRVQIETHDKDTYAGAASVPDLDAVMIAAGFERRNDVGGNGDWPDCLYERP